MSKTREMSKASMEYVCNEILDILECQAEQYAAGYYDGTPGGLEHMHDVWKLFWDWEKKLRGES
jgi:hypothetical protein